MALHLATLEGYEPSPRMAAYATAVHAALVEAGYPDAHVSANKFGPIVSQEHTNYEGPTPVTHFGPPIEVIQKAWAVCAPLCPVEELPEIAIGGDPQVTEDGGSHA